MPTGRPSGKSSRRSGSGSRRGLIPGTRPALWINTIVAWGGVILTNTLSALGKFKDKKASFGLFGYYPQVTATWSGRLIQQLSYFTMWSNIMVALVTLMLVVNPTKRTVWRKGLHLSALIMILVTAVVYATVIAPYNHLQGWSRITNPWQHIVTPALTWFVWLIWGPRDLSGKGVIPRCILIPMMWVGWIFLYGWQTGEYPYGFINVPKIGYLLSIRNILVVLAGALIACWLVKGLDLVLKRITKR